MRFLVYTMSVSNPSNNSTSEFSMSGWSADWSRAICSAVTGREEEEEEPTPTAAADGTGAGAGASSEAAGAAAVAAESEDEAEGAAAADVLSAAM